jgi:hypothetical protein
MLPKSTSSKEYNGYNKPAFLKSLLDISDYDDKLINWSSMELLIQAKISHSYRLNLIQAPSYGINLL